MLLTAVHYPVKSCVLTRQFTCCTQLPICLYGGNRIAAVMRCILPSPRRSMVHGNCFRETSVKMQKKMVQEVMRNVTNIYSSLCNNSNWTWFFNVLTFARSLGLGFQHLSQDLANVNTWKTMFDPYMRYCNMLQWKHIPLRNIQIFWKFYHQKLIIFQIKNSDIFHISAQNRLWVLIRTASSRWF